MRRLFRNGASAPDSIQAAAPLPGKHLEEGAGVPPVLDRATDPIPWEEGAVRHHRPPLITAPAGRVSKTARPALRMPADVIVREFKAASQAGPTLGRGTPMRSAWRGLAFPPGSGRAPGTVAWARCPKVLMQEGKMVGVAGFEPATPASRTRCSTRLSHTPTWEPAYRGQGDRPQARRGALHPVRPWAIPTPSRGLSALPFLLGNGVMVTQRFLVPSF